MFWDKWISDKCYVKSEVCAVEICFTETATVYHYSHLRNKNNKLELVATGSSNDSPVLPESILKNKIPLVLVVNGKGVILKKISLPETSEVDMEETIRQNLPAIQVSDFYVDLYKQPDRSGFIALCRKEQVEQLVAQFKAKKYELAALFLGAPSIIGLQPLWNNFNSLATSLHKVELTNNFLDTISSGNIASEETIKIEDLVFHPNYTLGFAGGLSYLMRRKIKETNSGESRAIEEKHLEKNKFRFLMLVAVGIAFFFAIVNVVFYTTYFDKNNKLETELSVYQGKYEQINKLLDDYQKNKNLIENAGVLNGNKLSEYADRIGKTLPEEVVLSDLYFNPKKEDEESEDSLVTFKTKSLVLKGNCSKSFIVNEWINVLKMQKFIKDVSLEKFVYNNQGMLPNFEIKLITE